MMKLIFVLFLVCTCLVVVNSSKVVVISPAVSKSVFFVLNAIAGELSARGHEVVILVPNSEQYLKNHPQVAMYPLDKFWEGLVNGTVNMNMKDMKVLEQLQFLSRMQNDLCRALLDSKILDQHRDAEIVIGVAVLSCSYIVPHILNVPHVTVQPAAMNFPLLRGVGQTTPLAYIPQLESRLTNDMTFFERVKNLVFYCFSEIILKVVINWGGNDIIKKNNISADKSFEQMVADTELVLVQADFALEDAQPVVPNVKLIGPVLPQPAKELDLDLESFMNSAGPEGVVLVSFGSVEVSGIRSRLADEVMARALAKLPFKVVWKIKDSKGLPIGADTKALAWIKQNDILDSKGLPIGANTKALAWIKQNDILGHPKTRVFVTHVGHNGMYESAYHAL